MRILTASVLVFLTIGCTAPDNPPVAHPDPPADTQALPDDPQTVAEPALDPVIRLKRLDAVLETDEQGNVLSITASGPLIVDEILEQIGTFQSLVTLNIEYTEITDAGLAHLGGLGNLKTLILRGTEITDEGLAHVEQLTTLTKIDVEFAPVSEEGVARLQKALPNCEINY